MSLTKYVLGSLAVAGGLVYHAMHTREQYFPAMLYLSTSKLSIVVCGNMAFALTLCLGHLLKAGPHTAPLFGSQLTPEPGPLPLPGLGSHLRLRPHLTRFLPVRR